MTALRTHPSFTKQEIIRYGAVLLVCASACTALVWLVAPQWWELSAYFWYSIPGNSFILLPHEPAVLYAGTLYHPFLVATVGVLATVPPSVFDYHLFKRVLELKPLAEANESRIARLAQRGFNWQPWWTTVVFAFSPIPFYPVRLLAPMAGYPPSRYVTAVAFGRWPRYYLLAWGGEAAANWLSWNPIF